MFIIFFVPKFFSFFLVPLYTSYLTAEEYGMAELIFSIAGMFGPFLCLSTSSAVMRFTIEDKNNVKPFQVSFKIYLLASILFAIGCVIEFLIFHTAFEYLLFIFFIAETAVLKDILTSYTRAIERISVVTFCSVSCSILGIISNIVLIAFCKLGLYGFLISCLLSYLSEILLLLLFTNKNRIFRNLFLMKDSSLRKDMLSFSIPLIFSSISWWIVSASDKYFVSFFCGVAANGIYSVALKIPIILKTVDNIFNMAWTFTVYDQYKTENGKRYIEKVYDFYYFLLTLGCSVLITCCILLARILFSNDFFTAWKYVPLLLIASVFQMFSSYTGIFLQIYKQSFWLMRISIINTLLNIALNFSLLYIIKDPFGVVISTLITFIISFSITSYIGCKLSNVQINIKKLLLSVMILILQSLVICKTENIFLTGIGILLIIIVNFNILIWAKDNAFKVFSLKISK